jgi:drug/metabolite transporter (DMT)-like permease
MLRGILAGLAAGALWGLTFVAPKAVLPYTEFDIAVLRYFAFGLTSVILMAIHSKFRPGPMSLKNFMLAIWLGATGFVVYFLCISFSINLAGPAIAPLVIGALPLLLALYGNWQDKNVPWPAIAAPLLLIALGLGIVNSASLATALSAADQKNILLGFGVAVIGLLVWFHYAILNARAMRAKDAPDALGWTSLQGLGAMTATIPVAIVALTMGWSKIPELGFAGEDGTRLIVWTVLTGVLASWLAQYFWTLTSQTLPLALSAQLIVSETLFALIYGFYFQGSWPATAEWFGGGLLILGVLWGVKVFSARAATVAPV